MNAFQQFIIARTEQGFVAAAAVAELVKLHRLCQLLVRCGGCRFTCAAQDLEHLKTCIAAGGDYVRDVCITHTEIAAAPSWRPESPPLPPAVARAVQARAVPRSTERRPHFNEADCGGVFDGFGVVSDADPGL